MWTSSHCPFASTKLYCLVTEGQVCKQHVQSGYVTRLECFWMNLMLNSLQHHTIRYCWTGWFKTNLQSSTWGMTQHQEHTGLQTPAPLPGHQWKRYLTMYEQSTTGYILTVSSTKKHWTSLKTPHNMIPMQQGPTYKKLVLL